MNKTITRIALLLALLTLALSIAACGSSSSGGGYTFKTSSGAIIAIGDKADDAISALGTAISKNESPSCGGIPGNDCVYTYSGFRVKTTPSNDGDVICQIELIDDSVKTPEGVYIGMSAEDAKAAMSGKGSPDTVGETLVFTKDGMKLQIVCRGGSVTGILYIAT